jgi:hypothetical protein
VDGAAPVTAASSGSSDRDSVAASARGAEDRLRRIEAVTDVALSKLDLEDLLAELLERIRDLLSADTAAVLLLEDSAPFPGGHRGARDRGRGRPGRPGPLSRRMSRSRNIRDFVWGHQADPH